MIRTRQGVRLDPVHTDTAETCPHCGGSNVVITACGKDSPHYSQSRCGDCDRHIRWNPRPWTPGRAWAFRMPYGQYKGQALGDLAGTPAGRSYLRWLARYAKGNPAAAATITLELVEARKAGAR